MSRRYFDADYVLMLSKLKEDLNTTKELGGIIGGEEYDKPIIECISRATDEILDDLKEIQLRFFQSVLNELNKSKSLKALEESVAENIKEVHTKIKGWP